MSPRIDFTDRHEHHPPNVKEYALEKAERLTRFFDGLQRIEIILDQEHGQHSAEILVSATHHMHFVGHATHDSVMASIDKVVDKLERQIVKAKERLRDHRRGEPAREDS